MHYGIRGCGVHEPPWTSNLSDIGPHVANFMLIRGEYAYLSTGWSGCGSSVSDHAYGWNEQWLDADYCQPVDEVCKETAPNSGVFTREWSKAVVQMDCNKWEPTVTWKSDDAVADFPPPAPGCSWLPSLPGGNGESGPCGQGSVGSCGPGKDFVSTHSLACSPPPGVPIRPELLFFTPGGGPANYSLLLSTAASWGFRSLAINFNNIGAPNSRCDGGPGHMGYGTNQTMAYADCMFDVEEERLFGIEHKNASMLWWHQHNFDNGCKTTEACPECPRECSPFQTVSQKESIVQRAADALTMLAKNNGSGWASYLLPAAERFGNRVAWNRTILSGHSRGSAYPLHIASYWRPKRLVFFCGLEDYQGARGSGGIRKPPNPWAGRKGLSVPAPWVQGYVARAKRLQLVPPEDMYGLGPMTGSCCNNWQATWSALGIPGQAFGDNEDGTLLPVSELQGAHRIYLRGQHQGHGTPIINCNGLGHSDPMNTGCCAFCGKGVGSCAKGNCTKKGIKCECAATDEHGAASLAEIWRYLFTSNAPPGSALPEGLQMHCCGSAPSGEHCCEDAKNLTGVTQCRAKTDDATPPVVRQEPYYAVEVDRVGKDRMNVLYDSYHHPETTDFAINNGPGYVRLLDGTDALVIRSCVHRHGCSTPANPDVITMVTRSNKEPVDLESLQSQFQKNALSNIILQPDGADEQCGVQDPRITVDPKTETYIMAYTAFGSKGKKCNATACGPTWQECSQCCNSVKTKVAFSKTPQLESSWVRQNRTGDPGFDEKSTAILVRDSPPHYQFTGTGTILSWQSDDLLHWTNKEVAIAGRQGLFDPGYVEAGCPPQRLADGNYFTTYDTIINAGQHGRHGWAAGWAVLNGSNPRQVLQRGGEPLLVPTMPWELQTAPEWNWTQAVQEGGVPMIGATNGLMPLGNDSFVAWACASDAVVEAFVVRVSKWFEA